MRNKRAIVVLGVTLALLHIAILFAGFIAPYDPAAQNHDLSYAPPAHLHIADSSGLHWPFVYRLSSDLDGVHEDRTRRYPIHLFASGDSYEILWLFRSQRHLFGVDEPAHAQLLGADAFGRDEFSRLLYGGQISLATGLLATFITLIVATLVGTVAGYYGRWVDESLMGTGKRIQGADIKRWQYGRWLRVHIDHPVIHQVPMIGSYFDIQPTPMSGSSTTPKQTTLRLAPSMRMNADLGDWSRSLLNITSGQSGQIFSSHYRDQWEHYYYAQSYPMQFTQVDAKSTLEFRP